jgi:CBS domain-containing protein
MKASQVMTRDVATVRPDTPVVDALRLMLELRISGLPVIDATGAVVGIVTEADFLHRGELDTDPQHSRWMEFLLGPGRLASEYVASHTRRIEQIMIRKVVTVAPDAPLADVVRLMEKHAIKRVPVVEQGRLAGIVSRADLLRALLDALAPAPASATGDAAIQRRIAGEIARQPWGPTTMAHVVVERGVADMRGVLIDDREREALRVLVENEPGVRHVLDHLATLEAMTGSVVRVGSDAN